MDSKGTDSGKRRRGLGIAARLSLSLSAVLLLALLSVRAADIWGVPFVEGHGLRERKRLEALKVVGLCADTLQDRFVQWFHERREDIAQSCVSHPEPQRLERLAQIAREHAGAGLLDRLRADPEYARAEAWLRALREERPDFTRLRVIDARSGLAFSGLPEGEVGRRAARPAATGLPADGARIEEREGKVLLWVSCALKAEADRPLLVLEAGVDLHTELASLHGVGEYLGKRGGALLADGAGNLVTSLPGAMSAADPVRSTAVRAAELAGGGREGTLEASTNASNHIVAYRPVTVAPHVTWGVVAWQDLGGAGWYLRDELKSTLLPLALGAAAVLLALFSLSRHLIRPVQQLSETAARVAEGDLSARATVTTGNEMGLLARTFNTMVERLQESRQALEQQVEERTAEIAARNRQLREEIELRQAGEERLRLFAAAIEDATEGIYIVDLEGRILYCNPAAAGQAGHVPAEVIGRSIRDLHRDPDLIDNVVLPAIRRTGRWAGEVPGSARNGRPIELWLAASLVRDPSGSPIAMVGLTRDLADQKKLEAEHVRTQKLESVGVLAGGLAHDFNNLLTIILGNLDLARLFAGTNAEAAEALDHAAEAALRAGDLTRQLITFSKGGQPVKRVGSIARMLRETVVFAAAGSNVAIEFDIPDDLPVIEFDEGQMRQVVHNLVQNAREAMPGGGTLRVSACATRIEGGEVASLPPGCYLCVEFADQGTGIAREHLSRIFDPYFSTKDMDTVKGRGLGLAVSYSIVRNHGGAIVADSLLGEGTRILVYLPESVSEPEDEEEEYEEEAPREPAAPVAPTPEGAAQEPEPPVEGPVRGRVLVMDDEPLVLGMAGSALRRLGYATTLCRSGAEAVVQYEIAFDTGRRYDAVILDLTVPGGLGGPETLARLRQIDPRVRAALSSGYTDHPAVIDWKGEGFAAFIAKPYSLKALEELLESIA